jgi:pimeloyl-ACP methyl ester carboxylesterase
VSFRLLLLLSLLVCGCATTARTEVRVAAPRPAPHGIIYSVDGAGDYHASSEALKRAVDEAGVPLDVVSFVWSHGRGRVLADQTDYGYARCQGQRLAERVCAYRQSHPNCDVYLVAHSAGSAVVLAAAESLPPESVERILLLAPSVSYDYDLRRALQTTRQGLDVFSSCRDTFSLGFGIALVGTADRQPGPAAGRVGFAPHVATPEDAALYAKLRQHPWQPCLEWTGNEGGHYGAYQDGYLRAYVLPLLR